MAVVKKIGFTEQEIVLSDLARSLGHPARIAILMELAKRNECICGEIVNVLPLAQSTVSQHLQELKKAGLIKGTVNGVKSCYCINWENFQHISDRLKSLFSELEKLRTESNCC